MEVFDLSTELVNLLVAVVSFFTGWLTKKKAKK